MFPSGKLPGYRRISVIMESDTGAGSDELLEAKSGVCRWSGWDVEESSV